MEELFKSYISSIQASGLQINQFSEVIVLCGGKINKDNGDPASAREFFLKRIKEKFPDLHKKIFLAETISAWAEEMIQERYTPDLLTFESHISSLASAVCLIVESPGSIAELGSFSLLKGVRERLMVVMRQEWHDQKSFISLGPVAKIKELIGPENNPIHIYPWGIKWDKTLDGHLPNFNDLSDHADDFIDDLKEFQRKLTKKPQLDQDNLGHLSLLISDVVNTFSALKIQEITWLLKKIGAHDTKLNKVKGHLFLLDKLGFLKKVSYGSAEYYVGKSDISFIKYNFSAKYAKFRDRARLKIQVISEIRRTDTRRLRAIRSA